MLWPVYFIGDLCEKSQPSILCIHVGVGLELGLELGLYPVSAFVNRCSLSLSIYNTHAGVSYTGDKLFTPSLSGSCSSD